MGTCPNCESYVSPGSNVCSCKTTFRFKKKRYEPELELCEYLKGKQMDITNTESVEYLRTTVAVIILQ